MSDYMRDKLNEEVYRHAIGKLIFCPVTGRVLDIRTAVVVESSDGERIITIVSPEGWTERGEAVLAKAPNLRVTELGKK
jgi:hypothetical protein